MANEFPDRVALVTGGSRGIGRAISLQLAREGADVAVGYSSRLGPAEEVAAEIQALGRRAICAPCDLRQQQQVEKFVAKTQAELGPIDLLVNCGAICTIAKHGEINPDTWMDTIDVNLNGTYRILFAVKDEMLARQFGRVVLISSVAALRPRPLQIDYSASKAGVIAMARSCAEAFAPHIRVNCIAPGLIDTEMSRTNPDDMTAALIQNTPLGRVGKPEEIAELACFLLSERSSFMSGQTVVASGGRITLP